MKNKTCCECHSATTPLEEVYKDHCKDCLKDMRPGGVVYFLGSCPVHSPKQKEEHKHEMRIGLNVPEYCANCGYIPKMKLLAYITFLLAMAIVSIILIESVYGN